MTNQNEVQKKLVRYQVLDGRIKVLSQRRELLLAKMLEIESTLNSIEEIKKSKGEEILLSLGSNVFVPSSLKKTGKMIIELGSNIAIENTPEKTKEILNKRKSIIEDGLKTVQEELIKLSDEFSRLEPEIQMLIERSRPSSKK